MIRILLILSCLMLMFTCDDPPYGVDCNGAQLDCAGECDGPAVEDICGVCDGPGYPDGECDCDGNVLDACGVCAGDNGTCTGCMDELGQNYDPDIIVDGDNCTYDPTLEAVGDINFDEEGTVFFTLVGSDVDGDVLTYSIVSSDNIVAVVNGANVTLTGALDFNGSEELTATASDGIGEVTQTFTVTVNPVNDAPVLATVDDFSFEEEGTISITLVGSDIDGDDLTYSISDGTNITVSIDGAVVSFTALANFNDSESFTATVSDGFLEDSQTFSVTVTPVNDAPVIDAIPDQEIDEDTSLVLEELLATDVDGEGDFLTFSASIDGNGSVSVDGTTLTVTPNLHFNGDIVVTVTVSDGQLNDSTNFTLTVISINDNPFIVSEIPDVEVYEDSENYVIDLTAVFNDVENGTNLVFDVSEEMDELDAIIDGSSLVISFNQNANGSGDITVTANDELRRLTVSDTFNVNIIAVNDAPVLDSIGDQTFAEDGLLVLNLSAFDVDGNDLTFSIEDVENLDIPFINNGDLQTASATIIGDDDFNGDVSLTVVVSDGTLSDEETFNISVTPVNDPPVLGDLSNVAINEDETFSVELTSSDIDGDDLTYSAQVDDNGSAAVDSSTLTVSPSADFNGDIVVTVTVSDGSEEVSDNFTLTVNPVNDAPVVDVIADQMIDEDAVLTLSLSASDVDGDDVTFSASVDGNGSASVDGTTLTVNPDADFNGDVIVTVTANDGALDGSTSFTLTVMPNDDDPIVADDIDDLTVNEDAGDTTIDLTNVFTDVDNDDVSITKEVLSNTNEALVTATIDGNTLTLSYVADANGTADITARATSNGLTVNDTFTVTVNAVNDAPTLTPGPDVTAVNGESINLEGWATNIGPGGGTDEDTQNISIAVTPQGAIDLFDTDPSIDPSTGNLTFVAHSTNVGTALIIITTIDDGGLGNGGTFSSTSTFNITVE